MSGIDKTKNTQVLVTMPHEMLEEIEEFQFKNRIKNRTEAIRILLKKALESE